DAGAQLGLVGEDGPTDRHNHEEPAPFHEPHGPGGETGEEGEGARGRGVGFRLGRSLRHGRHLEARLGSGAGGPAHSVRSRLILTYPPSGRLRTRNPKWRTASGGFAASRTSLLEDLVLDD